MTEEEIKQKQEELKAKELSLKTREDDLKQKITPEDAREQERKKLYPEMDQLKKDKADLAAAVKKQEEDLKVLLDEKKARDDAAAAASKKKDDESEEEKRKKLEEAAAENDTVKELLALVDDQGRLTTALEEKLEEVGKAPSAEVDKLRQELAESKKTELRTRMVAEAEKKGINVIQSLIKGDTAEEIQESIKTSNAEYLKIRNEGLAAAGVDPETISLPSGESQETIDNPVDDGIKKILATPRFTDQKDFEKKTLLGRTNPAELKKSIDERKTALAIAMKRLGAS